MGWLECDKKKQEVVIKKATLLTDRSCGSYGYSEQNAGKSFARAFFPHPFTYRTHVPSPPQPLERFTAEMVWRTGTPLC